jgi:hypothetical protein
MQFTKRQILEENKQLNESLLSWENALMALGFIPVIGEIADIALIFHYLKKGEKLYAALMLIALVPTVGDFVIKPIIKALKVTKEGNAILKSGVGLTEYLAKNPDMAKKFSSLSKYANSPSVTKTVENISKVNSSFGSTLKQMLSKLNGLGGSTVAGLKAGGKSVVGGNSFRSGLKDYFQGQRLSKYFAKRGVLPEKGISMWWQNVAARQDRKNAFRKFIMANNLLATFGIPSLSSFEDKLSNDEEFRNKVSNNPEMSDYIAQNMSPETQSSIMGGEKSGGQGTNFITGAMNLGMLKMLARMAV